MIEEHFLSLQEDGKKTQKGDQKLIDHLFLTLSVSDLCCLHSMSSMRDLVSKQQQLLQHQLQVMTIHHSPSVVQNYLNNFVQQLPPQIIGKFKCS